MVVQKCRITSIHVSLIPVTRDIFMSNAALGKAVESINTADKLVRRQKEKLVMR